MQKLTYAKATERLNEIMQLLDSEQLDIDHLAETLKEAKELIKFCKDKLYAVDKNIQEIMNDGNGQQ
jgi:exodeoxyribonuclease VII small subunit